LRNDLNLATELAAQTSVLHSFQDMTQDGQVGQRTDGQTDEWTDVETQTDGRTDVAEVDHHEHHHYHRHDDD